MLDALVLADRPVEDDALPRIARGAAERVLTDADRLDRNQDAFRIETVKDVGKALPLLADAVLFGPHPIVVKGTPEQKARWVPRLISGQDQCAFGFTEPDAGLNTTRIKTFAEKVQGGYVVRGQKVWTSTAQVASKIMLLTRTTRLEACKRPTDGITIFYTDLDRHHIEVQRIPKMGRKAVDSNAIFIEDLFIPDEHRIGEEGRGFSYILHSLNPERVLVGTEAVAIGRDALSRAARYAKERVVFGRPIGQIQGIQHPLAE